MDYIFIPLCLLLAGVFLDAERKKKYESAVILKGAASLCFVALGFLLAGSSREAGLICAGLVLGCVADVLLCSLRRGSSSSWWGSWYFFPGMCCIWLP